MLPVQLTRINTRLEVPPHVRDVASQRDAEQARIKPIQPYNASGVVTCQEVVELACLFWGQRKRVLARHYLVFIGTLPGRTTLVR